MRYVTKGVCARYIDLEIANGRVKSVKFIGGCSGNAQGIAVLVENMPVDEVIEKLRGIRCGQKNTSCPDQLARILEKSKE
jgi:uncharacterized protein (TIGR03905 family)